MLDIDIVKDLLASLGDERWMVRRSILIYITELAKYGMYLG
jgi:hypothetical protein